MAAVFEKNGRTYLVENGKVTPYDGGVEWNVPTVETKPDSLLGKGWNIGVDALQGVVDVPAAAAGLAGLIPGVNQVADPIYSGLQTLSKGIGDKLHTDPWLAKEAELSAAAATPGIMNSAGATLDFLSSNPSQIFGSVARSLPSMLAGGYLGKAATLGKAGAGTAAMVGEGLIGAGQSAGEIGQSGNGEYNLERLMGVPIGVATGLIAKGASKLMPEALDVDEAMARLAGNSALSGADKETGSLVTRSLKGLFKEGILEELPQSVQETALQNVAMGKPWDEGVGSAAVTGALIGGLMGGGYSAVGGGLRNLRIAQLEQEAKVALARNEQEKARLFQEEADRLKAEVEFERAQQNPVGALEALQEQTRRQAAIDAAMAGQDQALADRNEVFSELGAPAADPQAALEALSQAATQQREQTAQEFNQRNLAPRDNEYAALEDNEGLSVAGDAQQLAALNREVPVAQQILADEAGDNPLVALAKAVAPVQPTQKGKSHGRQKAVAVPAQVQETSQGQSQAESVRQDAGQGQNANEGLLTPPAKPSKPPSKSEQVLLDAVASQELTAEEAAEIRQTYTGRGAKGIPKAVAQVIEAKATAAARASALQQPASVRTLPPELNPLLAGMSKAETTVAQHLLESPGALQDRGDQLAVDTGLSEAAVSTARSSAIVKLKANAEALYGDDAEAKLTEAFGGVDPTEEVVPEPVAEDTAVDEETIEAEDDDVPAPAGDKNARSGAYANTKLAKGFDARAAAAGKTRRWKDLSQTEKLTLSDLHESLNQWTPEAQATKEGAAEYIAEKKALRDVEAAMLDLEADEAIRIQTEDAALRDAEHAPLKFELSPDQERQNKLLLEQEVAAGETDVDTAAQLLLKANKGAIRAFRSTDVVDAAEYWEDYRAFLGDKGAALPVWEDLEPGFKLHLLRETVMAAKQDRGNDYISEITVRKAYESYQKEHGAGRQAGRTAAGGTDAADRKQTAAAPDGGGESPSRRAALEQLQALAKTKDGRKQLDNMLVKYQVWDDTTATWVDREMSALKALEDVESKLGALRDFKLCLGG